MGRGRYIDPASGEFTIERGVPRSDETVASDVILALRSRRGYCAGDPDFGSRLHTIKKLTPSARRLAEAYVLEAIRHLIDRGEVRSPKVTAAVQGTRIEYTLTYRNAANAPALPITVAI